MKTLRQSLYVRKKIDRIFETVGLFTTFIGLAVLAIMIYDLWSKGGHRLGIDFLINFPSRLPEKAGILSSWVGSLLVVLVTASISIPLGVAAGIYLEEYSSKNKLRALIEWNIANLASVPSILYGLLALGVFVQLLKFGNSILTAGLTLGLLILPTIIVATREAVKTIPQSIREASYALGSTRWQTVFFHILPYSAAGIMTGVIMGVSRALGESAPLLTVGALTYIAFLPPSPVSGEFPFVHSDWLLSPYSVLPVQIFNWVSRPQVEFHENAAAGAIILLALTLSLNLAAIILRSKLQKKIKY